MNALDPMPPRDGSQAAGPPGVGRPGLREIAVIVLRRIWRFLVEYVRFKYIDGAINLVRYVQSLPRPESRFVTFGLTFAALTIVATPLFAQLGSQLPKLLFEDVNNASQSVPQAAFFLAIGLFSLAWAYILNGAAQGPGLLWILSSLFFMFVTSVVGFAIPPKSPLANLLLVVYCLPVVLGALTPGGRTWGKVLLAIFAAGIAMRSTPVPDLLSGAPWRLLWIPAGAVLVGLHFLIARRPWSSASRRVAFAAAVTMLYLLFVAWKASPRAVAETFNYSLTLAFSMIEFLWFVLGASFVAGAIELGSFARRMAGVIASEPAPVWTLLVFWVLAVLWLKPSQVPPPDLYWVSGWMAAALAALAVRWKIRGMPAEWLARWFVASIAGLVVVQTYLTLDFRDVLTRGAGVISVVMFVYAITMEVAGHISKVPLAAHGLERPSPLLLYLGVVLLVGASTLFGLAANILAFQKSVILNEYVGTVSLWIPIGLMTIVRGWPRFPKAALARVGPGFIWAAILAVPGFLLYADAGPGRAAAINVLAVAALSGLLVRRWRDVRSPLAGAVVGAAVGLGFAISIHRRVLIGVLSMLLTMIAGFTKDAPLHRAAQRMLVQAFPGTAAELDSLVLWQAGDQFVYYVIGTILSAGIAAVIAAMARDSASDTSPENRRLIS